MKLNNIHSFLITEDNNLIGISGGNAYQFLVPKNGVCKYAVIYHDPDIFTTVHNSKIGSEHSIKCCIKTGFWKEKKCIKLDPTKVLVHLSNAKFKEIQKVPMGFLTPKN